jgi:hypothetical protein
MIRATYIFAVSRSRKNLLWTEAYGGSR